VTAPEPQPAKPPTPAPEKQAPSAQDQAEASTPESEPAPGQVADPKPGETAQNSQVELNAGTSQATDSYLSKLSRHLSRFYEYPRRARRLGQEGVSVIVFRFQRNGTLIGHYLQDGSGHELLDKAALDMLKQAEPLPPVPEAMVGKTFSYALPVRFSLR
jgi:protein TonB